MNYPSMEEVNKLFQEGTSLNKLAEILGVHKNTIKNHYQKLGYKYDRALHQFIKNDGVTVSVTKSNTPLKQKKETNKDMNYIELEKRVKALEDRFNALNPKTIESDFILDSRVLRTDIKTRSIKVSATAMEAFTTLAETKLSMYSKQDLLSQALIEFADKYK